MSGSNFFYDRLKSFSFAFNGLRYVMKEGNFIVELCIGGLAIILGIICSISYTEWLIQIVVTGTVLSAEALNSAIEKLADVVHPGCSEKIGRVKDMAAAGVLLITFMAVAVGITIYVPYGIRIFL